jgi:hypothetical protein
LLGSLCARQVHTQREGIEKRSAQKMWHDEHFDCDVGINVLEAPCGDLDHLKAVTRVRRRRSDLTLHFAPGSKAVVSLAADRAERSPKILDPP